MHAVHARFMRVCPAQLSDKIMSHGLAVMEQGCHCPSHGKDRPMMSRACGGTCQVQTLSREVLVPAHVMATGLHACTCHACQGAAGTHRRGAAAYEGPALTALLSTPSMLLPMVGPQAERVYCRLNTMGTLQHTSMTAQHPLHPSPSLGRSHCGKCVQGMPGASGTHLVATLHTPVARE